MLATLTRFCILSDRHPELQSFQRVMTEIVCKRSLTTNACERVAMYRVRSAVVNTLLFIVRVHCRVEGLGPLQSIINNAVDTHIGRLHGSTSSRTLEYTQSTPPVSFASFYFYYLNTVLYKCTVTLSTGIRHVL